MSSLRDLKLRERLSLGGPITVAAFEVSEILALYERVGKYEDELGAMEEWCESGGKEPFLTRAYLQDRITKLEALAATVPGMMDEAECRFGGCCTLERHQECDCAACTAYRAAKAALDEVNR